MKVVFSDAARACLRSIALYISRDSKARAVSFVNELREAALDLGEYPLAWPLIPGYETYGHRRKPYKAYLIIYTVMDDQVVIDAILNAAQDFEAILFPE
jgi:toxin ParE1/3/4